MFLCTNWTKLIIFERPWPFWLYVLIVLWLTRSIHLIICEEALESLSRHLKDVIYSNLPCMFGFWLKFCCSNFGITPFRSMSYFKFYVFTDFIIWCLVSWQFTVIVEGLWRWPEGCDRQQILFAIGVQYTKELFTLFSSLDWFYKDPWRVLCFQLLFCQPVLPHLPVCTGEIGQIGHTWGNNINVNREVMGPVGKTVDLPVAFPGFKT